MLPSLPVCLSVSRSYCWCCYTRFVLSSVCLPASPCLSYPAFPSLCLAHSLRHTPLCLILYLPACLPHSLAHLIHATSHSLFSFTFILYSFPPFPQPLLLLLILLTPLIFPSFTLLSILFIHILYMLKKRYNQYSCCQYIVHTSLLGPCN